MLIIYIGLGGNCDGLWRTKALTVTMQKYTSGAHRNTQKPDLPEQFPVLETELLGEC